MNIIEKSESIRAGLRKGFQDGSSKIAQRKCYGYDTGPNGELVINPDEAIVVRWIFECYFNGDSLGKTLLDWRRRVYHSPFRPCSAARIQSPAHPARPQGHTRP